MTDTEFCARCLAGVWSDRHHTKCVVTGHAVDGESGEERCGDDV